MLAVIMVAGAAGEAIVGRNCLAEARIAVPLTAVVWGRIIVRRGWGSLSGVAEVVGSISHSGGG